MSRCIYIVYGISQNVSDDFNETWYTGRYAIAGNIGLHIINQRSRRCIVSDGNYKVPYIARLQIVILVDLSPLSLLHE